MAKYALIFPLGEHVLVAQTDAAICANSPHSVDEFLQYDWVGAPWGIPMKGVQYAPLGNGGILPSK
jgi:hypothetical protein